jgi:hypothetical protein
VIGESNYSTKFWGYFLIDRREQLQSRGWELGIGSPLWQRLAQYIHWWKKPLWSQFVWAIGPGCRTGIDYSGPMPVPVPARIGTDGSPRGRARSEGVWLIGLGSWHEPGSLVSAFQAIFVQRQGFVFFFYLFIWCFVFNLMVLHIYKNNEGTTLYIYYTSWSQIYYTPSHPSCLVETYYKWYSHEFDLIYIFFFILHPSKWTG